MKKILLGVILTLFLCTSLTFGGGVHSGILGGEGLDKIDNKASLGLAGTSNSLAYRVEEIEKHFHSRERWLGLHASPTGTNWADDVLTPFVAISGAGVYGAGASDEALVLGTDDTPVISGMTKFDVHRILVTDVDHDTPYKLRLVYGTGTMDAAVTAGQTSEFMVQFDATNPQLSAGIPVEVMMPRGTCGVTKIWIQARNATDNSEIDFLVGIHEYTY